MIENITQNLKFVTRLSFIEYESLSLTRYISVV